jgi:hypothetical protein
VASLRLPSELPIRSSCGCLGEFLALPGGLDLIAPGPGPCWRPGPCTPGVRHRILALAPAERQGSPSSARRRQPAFRAAGRNAGSGAQAPDWPGLLRPVRSSTSPVRVVHLVCLSRLFHRRSVRGAKSSKLAAEKSVAMKVRWRPSRLMLRLRPPRQGSTRHPNAPCRVPNSAGQGVQRLQHSLRSLVTREPVRPHGW